MTDKESAKSKWLSSGVKIKQVVRLKSIDDPGGGGGTLSINRKAAYFSLFLLLVIVWSAILLSAVFTLRINTDNCEQCPVGCVCIEAPPAWGGQTNQSYYLIGE